MTKGRKTTEIKISVLHKLAHHEACAAFPIMKKKISWRENKQLCALSSQLASSLSLVPYYFAIIVTMDTINTVHIHYVATSCTSCVISLSAL